ncbi:MAG: DUF998 domain-containing protein [Methanomassiliicoccales archaeon]|nr:DUF998 domain-containing protein [Methanomassiliicoccales archaeon]
MDDMRERLIQLGPLAGIAGTFSFNLLFIVPVSLHSDWRFGIDFMNVLGTPKSDAGLFNYAVMLMGALSVVFALGLDQFISWHFLGKISTFSFIVGSAALFLVGFFPINYGDLHDKLTWVFFIFVMSMILMVPLMWNTNRLDRIAFISIIIVSAFSLIGEAMVQLGLIRNELCEILVVLVLGVWIVVISVLMLLKLRKERLTVTPDNGS